MKGLSKLGLITVLTFAGGQNAAWAAKVIKGVVRSSDDKELLIGANVFVPTSELKRVGSKQTTLGTATDINGAFSLNVPDGVKKLTVRYIGYKEYTIDLQDGKQVYDVLLESNSKLNEVVVTGYQTTERRRLTAAISKVELNDAILGGVKSVDQALAGQIAGVSVLNTSGTPGAPARIRIRGTASLQGTQDPLWVLDGIPLEGTDIPKLSSDGNGSDIANISQSSIAGVSPSDIENITILKDAAATAIYGARAANGVIVVTTKKGRTGKPVINFSSKISYAPKYSIDRLNLLNASEKVDMELRLLPLNQKPSPFDPDGAKVSLYPEKGGVAEILRNHNLLSALRNNGLSAITAEAMNEINALRGINTDWNSLLFRNALTSEYNVSVSGGSDKVSYYTSLGYSDEQGNVRGVGLQRLNMTAKLGYQFTKKFKVGAAIFLNRRSNVADVMDAQGNVNPVYYSRTVSPYLRPYDAEGNYIYNYDAATSGEPDKLRGFNIFEERANTDQTTTTTGINTIFDAEYRFSNQWKLSSQLGIQWEQNLLDELTGKDSYTMRDLRERDARFVSGNKVYLLAEGGRHRVQNRVLGQFTWKGLLEYKNTFADLHNLQFMAGSELRRNRYDAVTTVAYGYNPQTLTTVTPIFRDQSQANRYPLHTEVLTRNAFASFFVNGSYTYDDRYTLGGSVRLDGSDLFGVDPKYRYLPIYSVSALWRASNEGFLKTVKWIDNLALRASYGLQGNIDKNTSPYLVGTYGTATLLPNAQVQTITISSAPNDKLRWEKTASYNLGFDFSVLNQAINLGVDYYYRRGTDLIGYRELPLENGFASQTVNWAEMNNSGIEVNLQTRNISTKDFSWYTNFNFAYNDNKVVREMQSANDRMPSREGYPVGAIFALPTAGVNPENGGILYDNGDGTSSNMTDKFKLADEWGIGSYGSGVSDVDQRKFYKYIGSSDAPITGGLNNTFNYKNWELNVNIAYYLGGYVRTTPTYDITSVNLGKNMNQDALNSWTSSNTSSQLPGILDPNKLPADYSYMESHPEIWNNLDIWVKKQNYFRLQNVRLAYMLPSELIGKIGFKSATVAVEARNLLVFGSSFRNFLDPETMGNRYATPIPRSFTFNLNFTL